MLVAEPLADPVLRVKWRVILPYEHGHYMSMVITVGSHMPNKLCHQLFLRFYFNMCLFAACLLMEAAAQVLTKILPVICV